MSALYAELRGRMIAMEKPTVVLAHRVGVTAQTINNILSGRTQPRLDLCYEILAELDETPDKIAFYFPPNGVRVEVPSQTRSTRTVIRVGKGLAHA